MSSYNNNPQTISRLNTLSLYIYSTSRSFELQLHPITIDSINIYNEIVSVFGEINGEKVSIKHYVKLCNKTKKRLLSCLDKYKTYFPYLNQFISFVDSTKRNEYIFVSPINTYTQEDMLAIGVYLSSLNRCESIDKARTDFDQIIVNYDELFGELLSDYNILSMDGRKKTYIGEPNKKKRVCRFCGKSMNDGIKFKQVKHAIPEFLGNNNILLNEECDTCNNIFGGGVEHDTAVYFEILRVFWNVSGKDGKNKFIFKNASVENNENTMIVLANDGIVNQGLNGVDITLRSNKTIASINIYKTLCKIAMSVIPNDLLENFTKTIEWINGENKIDESHLPKIAFLLSNREPVKEPAITIYTRKSDNKDIPYMVCELVFVSMVIVYVIPASNKDSKKFSSDSEYKEFFKFFKHYSSADGWKFRSFSCYNRIEFSSKLVMRKSN